MPPPFDPYDATEQYNDLPTLDANAAQQQRQRQRRKAHFMSIYAEATSHT